MKRINAILAAVTLIVCCASGSARSASGVFDVDREFYPYYPSLIKWNKSNAPFTPPDTCANCHPLQHQEWTGSVHSLAFHDPIYQGELNKAVKAVGHDIARQCEGCHSPAGMVTGEIKGPGLAGLSDMAKAGVSCDICHSISGTTHWQTPSHEPENGSMILTPGVQGTKGTTLVKRGPFKPKDGCGGGFHSCEESSLHLRADLCASCHQVYHYDAHFPLEATYLEWKHGPYAQKEILCQDCHMVDVETFLRSADEFKKPGRKEYRHYFSGANYLLQYLAAGAVKKAGNPELAADIMKKYEMAVTRLKSAADLEVSPVYREGKLAEVRVRVKNIRAGHNLPTSLTNVRQMWLEVTARDEKGAVLFESGTVDPSGKLPENVRMFNSDGMGNDFHFAVDPWVVTAFSRHDTIPPRGYKDVFYGLSVPPGVAQVNLEVKLRYRQADQQVAEALLGAVPKDIDLKEIYGLEKVPPLPVVDMVVKKAAVSSSI
ncbi:multiheme c-type cytochrome [Geobacter sp. DSM 9736]|uniref:multiheme c-type cytochrome n=1 Tax=Geobacter sp. DSM 9736 TaxID=1277350 RepID=UPI000B5036AC|nr:multiheme c-type cytochrome [Geobacter sp. DSM 9736]SNB46727.1 Cytochrome c554 and c-prime [Geobacter sp. DSM 9736]